MDGPFATLCTLHLKTPHESQPKATGGKQSLCASTVHAHAFEWKCSMLLCCQSVQLESLVQSRSPLFCCNFRIVCVVCSAGVHFSTQGWRSHLVLLRRQNSHDSSPYVACFLPDVTGYPLLCNLIHCLYCGMQFMC